MSHKVRRISKMRPLLFAAGLLGAAVSHAQSGAVAVDIDIPAEALDKALANLARQSGAQIVFASDVAAGKRAAALKGQYGVREALDRLLAGSGLVTQAQGDLYTVVAEPDVQGATQLRAVTVTAQIDDTTTEGSGSYTSPKLTIGKSAQTMRETPNSVSVVTRQRIEDQNFATIEDAMQYTTAMKVMNYGTTSSAIESRGYTIDRYQIDGVASSLRVYENNFALAMYDRIEVWRGPAGMLQGASDPGGSINLVRKRAEQDFNYSGHAYAGSWDNDAGDVDVTGPLLADGSLRGRVVASYQDSDNFVDDVYQRIPMVYATLEYDLTPDTTLSIGNSWQKRTSRPFYGLSAYADGTYPQLPRSTYIGADWNHAAQRSDRSFVELERKFDNGGNARLSANYTDRRNASQIAWGNSMIGDADNDGVFDPAHPRDVLMLPYFSWSAERETNVDAQWTQPFELWGLAQQVLLGANYQRFRTHDAYNASTYGDDTFVLDTFEPDVHVTKPDIAIDEPASRTGLTQSGVYAQARIKPWAPLTLIGGGRLGWYRSDDFSPGGEDQSEPAKFVPYAAAIYDFMPQFSLYGSYSSVFNPQSDKDVNLKFLPPRRGDQWEAGIKGEHLDGRVNSSLSFYRIEDVNRALYGRDDDHPDAAVAAGKVRSQGFEAEVGGQLLPNWNLNAGYGYNENKQITAPPGQEDTPLNSFFPRHTFSLWSDYRIAQGVASGLGVGAGVKFRSHIYSTDGVATWHEGSYAVYAAQLNYTVAQHWRTSLTVNNLFDKNYIDRPDTGWRQTYYGEPRNVMFMVGYNSR
ncbi:TonB-dependent siderophore receptor [Solimonas soli]|uniref:TonB-dependent siderophore receptor n=1 Tax=Solimonas soli TaxID=413479 RepID=UPI0012F8B7A6|nr:TonB-dependent siderophore receptor [Solimonas soli]